MLGKTLFEIFGMSCVIAEIGAMEDINPKLHFTESCYMGKLMGFDRLSPNGLGLF